MMMELGALVTRRTTGFFFIIIFLSRDKKNIQNKTTTTTKKEPRGIGSASFSSMFGWVSITVCVTVGKTSQFITISLPAI